MRFVTSHLQLAQHVQLSLGTMVSLHKHNHRALTLRQHSASRYSRHALVSADLGEW